MGTGLHGTNGLPVGICTHLYEIYILPRAPYDTEAIVLSTDDISKLEKFQRYTLRCILGLPERTAFAGIHPYWSTTNGTTARNMYPMLPSCPTVRGDHLHSRHPSVHHERQQICVVGSAGGTYALKVQPSHHQGALHGVTTKTSMEENSQNCCSRH